MCLTCSVRDRTFLRLFLFFFLAAAVVVACFVATGTAAANTTTLFVFFLHPLLLRSSRRRSLSGEGSDILDDMDIFDDVDDSHHLLEAERACLHCHVEPLDDRILDLLRCHLVLLLDAAPTVQQIKHSFLTHTLHPPISRSFIHHNFHKCICVYVLLEGAELGSNAGGGEGG